MKKIAHISVRDFRKIVITQKPKAFTFSNISNKSFRIYVKLNFALINLLKFIKYKLAELCGMNYWAVN